MSTTAIEEYNVVNASSFTAVFHPPIWWSDQQKEQLDRRCIAHVVGDEARLVLTALQDLLNNPQPTPNTEMTCELTVVETMNSNDENQEVFHMSELQTQCLLTAMTTHTPAISIN